MKNLRSLLLCLCLMLVCASSFVACSNDDSDKAGTQSPSQNGGGVENGNQPSNGNTNSGNNYSNNNNSNNNDGNTALPKPEEKSNFELICEEINNNDLHLIFNCASARQLLHITYGYILSEKQLSLGITETISSSEDEYYSCYEKHIAKQLESFLYEK